METITIKEDNLNDFIIDNFTENSLVEISFNRVFIPGILLNINDDDELILTLRLQGQLLHQTVDINIDEIKSEVVEIRYSDVDEQINLVVI
ncbi:DUF2097 family protein [Methanosphaera sp. BMS]|uniref:DUF2097 family protein n=1 Tax=Methanosphaera sp. BMS TaxID=1789762 RepID=UPI000DC1E911|nr:DUF2097 family protein [Methanosphaera sp. BMS]AWX32667.1 hypothetical protein AW729_05955 [Methanosphaera sp. BMS]